MININQLFHWLIDILLIKKIIQIKIKKILTINNNISSSENNVENKEFNFSTYNDNINELNINKLNKK